MKKSAILFLLLSFLGFAQSKKVTTSDIRWKAYKALNADAFSHYGTIKLKAGNIVMNGSDLAGGNFILDMNSIVADDMKNDKKMKLYLEKHLKSDDFFDVKKYPTVFFKIVSVKKTTGKYNSQITGNLTIKNTTKSITFPANVVQKGSAVEVNSAQFTFNRKDFGLNYDVFEDMIIKNDVEMNVKFTAK